MRKIIFIITFFVYSYSQELLVLKQQNILQIKNIVKIEEKIAENFEKFILEKQALPNIEDLIDSQYLVNRFGVNINFKDKNNLQLNYALLNSENKIDVQSYIKLLYNTEVYRKNTYAVENRTTPSKSYTLISLKSEEAKNLFKILKTETIEATCTETLVSKYCNLDENSIRWYNSTSNWIEYSKKDFESGDVVVKNINMLTDDKVKALPVGKFIYVKNSLKFIKLINSDIKKVD